MKGSAIVNQYNLSGLRIDPKVFQHPADKAVTDRIQQSKEFSRVIGFISENSLERMLHGMYLSTYAHLTPSNASGLVRMSEEAGKMFGLDKTPELFIRRSYNMSAEMRGIKKPVMMLSTEMINNYSERAVWAAIASCACRAKTGYCEIDMIDWTIQVTGMLLPGNTAKMMGALIDQWKKVSQLTLDRAALIASGDLNTAMEVILGGEMPMEVLRSIDFRDPSCGYMQQCREFAADQGNVLNTIRAIDAVYYNKAMLATRYTELFNFYQTEYQDLMEEYAG